MQSSVGQMGRVVLAKFENDEDFIGGLEALAQKHEIKAGTVIFLGALKEAKMVTGPKMPVVPPVPNWFSFDDGREIFGVGTIFWENDKPKLHLHAGTGKGKEAIVGCLRENANIFLVIEAVIFEINGIKADKALDPETGLTMLRIQSSE